MFLVEIEDMFQVQSFSFDVGTRYLCYLINPNRYKAGDWLWLLQIFDRRIKHWCWHWLSLGGRLILARYVLVNLVVFWFFLCNVLKSIMDEILKKVTVFISFGNQEHSKYHLVRWEIIARPIEKRRMGY